jgi:uncharacterized membrane protein
MNRAAGPERAELPMRNDGHDFARLTNLADGIFAVAMAFLAFTIQIPPPGPGSDGSLVARLGAMLPQFGTLALSFFIAARLWMLHFKMHRVITRGNDVLLVLNMVLLFGIVLIPFCADVLSTYPLSPLSVSIYATNTLVMLAMDVAIWCYARTRPHFLAEGTPPDYPTRMMRYSLQIAAVFGGSIVVAWFAPRPAAYMWAMILPIILLQARGLSRASAHRLTAGDAHGRR